MADDKGDDVLANKVLGQVNTKRTMTINDKQHPVMYGGKDASRNFVKGMNVEFEEGDEDEDEQQNDDFL